MSKVNPKDKVHPSVHRLNNFADEKGNSVDPSREHVQSGPQTASRHEQPAPAFRKVKPGLGK